MKLELLEGQFVNLDNNEKKHGDFLITAFMLKVLKYGNNGLKLDSEDFKNNKKLSGKVLQVESKNGKLLFKIVNDPRN